jgi:hypothetical protein
LDAKRICQVPGRSTIVVGDLFYQRSLIIVMPMMAAVVMVIVVMTIIGLALVIVTVGTRRADRNGDLSFRFRRNQSEKPQGGENQ